jgi:hypothetical protein
MFGHGSSSSSMSLLVDSDTSGGDETSDAGHIDNELLRTGGRGKVGGRQKGKRDMVMQTQK